MTNQILALLTRNQKQQKNKNSKVVKEKDYSYYDDPAVWKDRMCNSCHQPGHCAARCPELSRATQNSDGEEETEAANRKTNNKNKKKTNCALMVAWTGATAGKYLIALDDCAYRTVLCNEKFVSDIVRGKCPPLLSWVGESYTNDASGNFHPFGACELNKNAPINLLSAYEVRSRFLVEEKWNGDGPAQGVIFQSCKR